MKYLETSLDNLFVDIGTYRFKETNNNISNIIPVQFNPLSPNIHIQILQTDVYTFPLRIS